MKNRFTLRLNKDFFLEIIVIIAGIMMIGSFLPKAIRTFLIGTQLICAVILLLLSFKKTNKFVAFSWVIMVMFIYMNVRTYNSRTVLYCLQMLTGGIIVFCGNDAYKSMYNSIKIIVWIGVFAALTTYMQIIIPEVFSFIVKKLSEPIYAEIASSMRVGRYLGLTDYVWYTVMMLLMGGGYLLSRFNGKISENRQKATMVLVLFSAVILAGSRSSMILFPILVVFFYGGKKKGSIVFVLLIVGGLFYYYLTHTDFTSGTSFFRIFYKLQKLIEQISSGEEIDTMRDSLKSRAMSNFFSHPVFGIGWFEFSNQSVYLYGSDRFFHVHNLYAQLLAENGAIGTLIVIFTPITIYVKNILTLNRLNAAKLNNTDEYRIAKYCLMVLTYLYVASWLHVTIFDGQTMIIFNMICAMSLGVSEHTSAIDMAEKESSPNALLLRRKKKEPL